MDGGRGRHLHCLLVELRDLAVGRGGQHGGDVAREVQVLQLAQGVDEPKHDKRAEDDEDDEVRDRARRDDRLGQIREPLLLAHVQRHDLVEGRQSQPEGVFVEELDVQLALRDLFELWQQPPRRQIRPPHSKHAEYMHDVGAHA
eukprot:2786470-Rhodomonas_salina.1